MCKIPGIRTILSRIGVVGTACLTLVLLVGCETPCETTALADNGAARAELSEPSTAQMVDRVETLLRLSAPVPVRTVAAEEPALVQDPPTSDKPAQQPAAKKSTPQQPTTKPAAPPAPKLTAEEQEREKALRRLTAEDIRRLAQERAAQRRAREAKAAEKRPSRPTVAAQRPTVQKRPTRTTTTAPAARDRGCGKKGGSIPLPSPDGPQPKWICKAAKITADPVWKGKQAVFTFVIGNEGLGDLKIKLRKP